MIDDQHKVFIEYAVLEGGPRSVRLAPGERWTFGRSTDCSQTLTLPALSRLALVIEHLTPGTVRVTSRQSSSGRVVISSDDDTEQHSLGPGVAPVFLAGGNYTLKVELPPIVLRMLVAVPHQPGSQPEPESRVSPKRVAERTALSWAPDLEPGEGREWITVTALAVALSRYPELVPTGKGSSTKPVKMSEALRRAAGVWCGRTSQYWVNERLKEAAAAADLEVPEGGERLAVTVAHYAPLFSRPSIRELRDALLEKLREGTV